jgi:uncharacterized OsmC-like protein
MSAATEFTAKTAAKAPATTTSAPMKRINGVKMDVLERLVEGVQRDPANAMTRWGVATRWTGGTRSETRVRSCEIGGRQVEKDFTLRVDEPDELAGTNTSPNPQEYLLAALNSCMMVGYVALASIEGIELQGVEIESAGEIDLRGFLGLDPSVKAGFDRAHYTVRIKGNGTREQFERIHRTVMATSPNQFNFCKPVELTSELVVA